MDIGYEHFASIVQGSQEGWFLTVPGINADPFEPHAPGSGLAHDVQRVFAFRCQLARGLRDLRLVAARGIPADLRNDRLVIPG
jgi:hypothetical protein